LTSDFSSESDDVDSINSFSFFTLKNNQVIKQSQGDYWVQ
jgi:hypothetical protein